MDRTHAEAERSAAAVARPYMFDNTSAQEYQRLDLMSQILDPWTRGYLTALGVAPGWNCLELGGGNGSITAWLAERVGLSGRVVAVDIYTALLELLPNPNVAVQELDVRSGALPGRDYDLVTCRAMLHQIADDAPAVLAKMAAAIRPGGWLLVQEPDFHLAATTEPEAWAAAWQGVLAWGRQQGVDWFIGRRLPSLIDGLGLQHTQAKTDVQNIRGRDRGALYFQLFFAEVREPLLASGLLDAKTFDAASALLDDPTSWTQCWMMTAVWARKPDGASAAPPTG